VHADEFFGDDVEVGMGAPSLVVDGAAGIAGVAGERDFEGVGEERDFVVAEGGVRFVLGAVAELGFGELGGECEFAGAGGAGEDPGAGEALGVEGALELGESTGLAENVEHDKSV